MQPFIRTIRAKAVVIITGIPCMIVSLLLFWVYYNKYDISDKEEEVLVLGMSTFFFVAGVYFITIFKNYRVRIDEEGIVVWNLLGKRNNLLWTDIRSIDYGLLRMSVVINSKSNDVLKVSTDYINSTKFVRAIISVDENFRDLMSKDIIETHF